MALFPKSTIKPRLPQPQVTVTLGAFWQADQGVQFVDCTNIRHHFPTWPLYVRRLILPVINCLNRYIAVSACERRWYPDIFFQCTSPSLRITSTASFTPQGKIANVFDQENRFDPAIQLWSYAPFQECLHVYWCCFCSVFRWYSRPSPACQDLLSFLRCPVSHRLRSDRWRRRVGRYWRFRWGSSSLVSIKGLFKNGIPVHDTIARIISGIKPEPFQAAFVRWTQAINQHTEGALVAIDGKTLRSSYNREDRTSTIHMVAPMPPLINWCSDR